MANGKPFCIARLRYEVSGQALMVLAVQTAVVDGLSQGSRADAFFVTNQGVLNGEAGRPAWGLSLAEYYLSRCT